MKYGDTITQFRVEARVAAALTWAIKVMVVSPLLRDRIETWLYQWERRFLTTIQYLPFKECDLATATFAARTLLNGKEYQETGERVLAEAT